MLASGHAGSGLPTDRLGGRRFLTLLIASAIYLLCVVWSYFIRDWTFPKFVTPFYFGAISGFIGFNTVEKWRVPGANGSPKRTAS